MNLSFKKKIEPEIQFKAAKEILNSKIPFPVPMSKIIPEWYKKMPVGGEDLSRKTPAYSKNGDLVLKPNIKSCVPILDYLTSGYTILTSQDIAVEAKVIGDEPLVSFNWKEEPNMLPPFKGGIVGWTSPMGSHPRFQIKGSPLEKELIQDQIFKYNSPWKIHTPKGYSCLFLPIEYQECPFHALPAIVDTDEQHVVAYPFRFRGKEGAYTIPIGTPVVQVIPFKRENWTSKVTEWTEDEHWAFRINNWAYIYRMYKKLFHKRKVFR